MSVTPDELTVIKYLIEGMLYNQVKPKKRCKVHLSNGKRCSFQATCNNDQTCKKHENNLDKVKIFKNVIYHNHLPFEIGFNCALCEKNNLKTEQLV